MATDKIAPKENEELNPGARSGIRLKKELGVLNGVAIIVGIIVGSGIFVSPRGVLEQSGSIGLALIIWVMCGLLCMLGALCYAELGTSIPKSGGDYAYIYEAFGPIAAFLFLWVAMLIIMPAGNAISALTFANYVLQPFFPTCDPPVNAIRLLAALVVYAKPIWFWAVLMGLASLQMGCPEPYGFRIFTSTNTRGINRQGFLTFINCYNVKWANKVQVVFTFAKIIALLIIIFAGIIHLGKGNTQNFTNSFEGTTAEPGYIALSFYAGLFSYSGWNYLNFVTEELKKPYRNLPRAIYISLPLVTVIYVLVNIAYFAVLTSGEVLSSNAVAVTFGDRILGIASFIMPISVALSTFGGLNGSIFASSRLFFVGAREGHLPRALSMININFCTPTPSLVFLGILTLVYLTTTQVYVLITYTSFIEALFLTLSVAGMLKLRFTKPNMPRPIKVNLILPIAFFLVCLFLVVFPFYVSPLETGIGVAITVSGIPVYFIAIYWKDKPYFLKNFCDNFTAVVQKVTVSIPQDIDD